MYPTMRSVMIAAAISIVPLASCSDAPLEPAPLDPVSADAALTELAERVSALGITAAVVGSMTPALMREVERLKGDVESWQARTGRDDIAVTTGLRLVARPSEWDRGRTAALDNDIDVSCGCAPFKYIARYSQHCFLILAECADRTVEPNCSYACFTIRR
jgi:hypothetical protein